jgi:hypothetical protein
MEATKGLGERWARLLVALADEHGVDVAGFEQTVDPLGAPARRLLVTCWERLGICGFRGALKTVALLRGWGHQLRGFALAAGSGGLELDLRFGPRLTVQAKLDRSALFAGQAVLDRSLRGALHEALSAA